MSIQVQNIEKHFGAFHALKNISLDFPDGQLVALLGVERLFRISR